MKYIKVGLNILSSKYCVNTRNINHSIRCFGTFQRSLISRTTPCRKFVGSTAVSTSAIETFVERIKLNSFEDQTSKYERILNDNHKVFIGGKYLNHNKSHLRALFSQFGSIYAILVPQEKKYNANPSDSAYRFAFVFFHSTDAVQNALKAKSIQDGDQVIDIKATTKPEIERTIIIHDLPATVCVKDILNSFRKYGEINFINYVYNAKVQTTGLIKNFAFVVFKDLSNMHDIIDQPQFIGTSQYPVTQCTKTSKQRKDRCRKVYVTGIPESMCEEEALNMHFSKACNVQGVFVFKNKDTNKPTGDAIVEFLLQKDAHLAEDIEHVIGGQVVNVRALGWSNEDLDRKFYEKLN